MIVPRSLTVVATAMSTLQPKAVQSLAPDLAMHVFSEHVGAVGQFPSTPQVIVGEAEARLCPDAHTNVHVGRLAAPPPRQLLDVPAVVSDGAAVVIAGHVFSMHVGCCGQTPFL